MRPFFKVMAAAAVMSGAALFASAPARASDFSISIGVPGVGFSYDSGGYCDRWGCPDAYWDMPVYYGPVYFGGEWYRGPVYYRVIDGDYWYWIHGGWHRDQWRGRRPHWWGHYRYGPALGYDYYRGHGFRHDRDRHWRGDDWRAREMRHDRHEWREERRDRLYDRRDDRRDRHEDRRDRRDRDHYDGDHHHD